MPRATKKSSPPKSDQPIFAPHQFVVLSVVKNSMSTGDVKSAMDNLSALGLKPILLEYSANSAAPPQVQVQQYYKMI